MASSTDVTFTEPVVEPAGITMVVALVALVPAAALASVPLKVAVPL